MTALQEQPLAERIQADRMPAEGAAPAEHRVLGVIGAVFFAIGWVIGAIVSVIGFMIGAIRYGYRQGRMGVPPPPKMPSQPQPASAANRA